MNTQYMKICKHISCLKCDVLGFFSFALLILYRFSKMSSLFPVLKQRKILVLNISRTNYSLIPIAAVMGTIKMC